MYSFKQLELFISLARTERVVETAKEYEMSQSAVSMSIRELEKELHEQLFDRIGKKLILNDRGHLLLERSKTHVEGLKDIYANFNASQLMGELRITASVTIADYLMPYLLNDYLGAYSGLSVKLKSANTSDVIKQVKSGECDLGFVEGDFLDSAIESNILVQDELVVVSRDAKLLENGALYIDQLLHKKWILREEGSGTRSIFLKTIAPLDKEINIFMEFENIEAIKNFLLSNDDYISALPRICVENELQEGRLFEIKVKNMVFKRDFILVKRKDRVESALMKHFKDFVMQRFV
ncbi:MAG: LysR family transcriptional regulator [Helicobacteraceae bacterium]|jgi:DNA-binding transcriptional LysR family regulator|nr:LysR family transcriptional regulator [Helicobacteraceae bacterium]